MPVRFILGAAGSGKTHYCLNRIIAAEEKDPLGTPIYFILPEQATFIHEKLLCEMSTGGGFCRARVFSFNRLVSLAHKEQGQPMPPAISEAGKLLLAGKVIADDRDKLETYARSAASPAFADQLVKAAEEMSAYGVSPDGLDEAVLRMAEKGADDRQLQRLREIALLYRDYKNISADYAGYGENMAYLAESIRKGFLRGCDIYIGDHADFTPAEMSVIAALMEDDSRTVHISLPVPPEFLEGDSGGRYIFAAPLHCYNSLGELAEKAHARVLPPVLLDGKQGRFAENPEMRILEQCMSGHSVLCKEKPRSIFLYQAGDLTAEIEGVGRQIIRLTREQGLKYSNIGVVTRDTDSCRQEISRIFGSLGIPFFIDAKKPLMSHPLFELIRAALECWAYHPAYERIIRFAKNPLLPISPEEADLLDEYSRSHGLRFWHWLNPEPWDFPPMPEELPGDREQAETIRRKACGPLLRLIAELPQNISPVVLNEKLLSLLEELHIEEALKQMTDKALAENRAEDAACHGQAWEKLMAFLEEASVLLGEKEIPASRLLGLYDTALKGLTVSTIPPGVDQVFVSSLERSRNPELAAVFVISLNDGVLPRRVVNDGLFSDADRRGLRQNGASLAADAYDRQFLEEYFAYIAMTRSGGQLYLSYTERDSEGKEAKPSPLLRRIQSAFPGLEAESYQQLSPELLVGGETDLAKMALALGSGGTDGFWSSVYAYFAGIPEYAEDLEQLRQGLEYTPLEGRLSPEVRRQLYGNTIRGSVSRVEKFRNCPFAWFTGYGLKLKRRREYELDNASRGELYHNILADIGTYVLENGIDWQDVSRVQATALVEAAMEKYLPQLLAGILQSSARYQYLAGRIRDTLVGAVLVLAEHCRKGSFIPVAWELPFGGGDEDALPAFRIELDDGRAMILSGRIDRVDMAKDDLTGKTYFRIIDNKSTSPKLSPADIYAGLRLQLLVYLEVVLANADVFTSADPAIGGIYYTQISDSMGKTGAADMLPDLKLTGITPRDEHAVKLADREINGHSKLIPMAIGKNGLYKNCGMEEEQFEKLRLRLLEVLKETAGEMMDGLISVSPIEADDDNGPCKFCDYAAVCGFDRTMAKRRKKQVPEEFAGDEEEGGEE